MISEASQVVINNSMFDSKFGPWTISQAGLTSCLAPWNNVSEADPAIINDSMFDNTN